MVSLPFDACHLDDWPPFLDLGLLIGSKCFRRLLVAGKNLDPSSAIRIRTVGSAKDTIAELSFATTLCGVEGTKAAVEGRDFGTSHW